MNQEREIRMIQFKKITLCSLVAALFLVGCDGNGIDNKQGGALLGAALGGAAASTVGSGSGKTAAIIAGTVGGAAIGGKLGNAVDHSENSSSSK